MKKLLLLLWIGLMVFTGLRLPQDLKPPLDISLDSLIPHRLQLSNDFFGANLLEDMNESSEQGTDHFAYQGISLGTTLDTVVSRLGDPVGIYASEYPFEWYVFHDHYHHYVQVGVVNESVVALYSNDDQWQNPWGFDFNTTASTVESILGTPLDRIRKQNIIYLLPEDHQYLLYKREDFYLTVFFDIFNDNQITSFLLIDKDTEESYHPPHQLDTELAEAYSKQVFYLTNAIRTRHNLPVLTWHPGAANTALAHSKDMANQNFFDHNNPQGESPFDRMRAQGLRYQKAGENIAAGQQNAIFAHEGWMNSEGHRQAILEDFKSLGVGVYLGGPLGTYYTQNFIK